MDEKVMRFSTSENLFKLMKLIRLMQIKVIKERIEIFKNILDQCWRVRSTTAILGHLFQHSSLIGQHRSCESMLSCDWSTSATAALEMINQWLLHNFSNTFSQRKESEKTKLNQHEESFSVKGSSLQESTRLREDDSLPRF